MLNVERRKIMINILLEKINVGVDHIMTNIKLKVEYRKFYLEVIQNMSFSKVE
jgi:hypothetical protein